MEKYELGPGDTVRIEAEQVSGAKVMYFATDGNEGIGDVHIESTSMYSLGLSAGDEVLIEKSEFPLAEVIILEPADSAGGKGIGGAQPLRNSRVLTQGDLVTVTTADGEMNFKVISVTPEGGPCITGAKTRLQLPGPSIMEKPEAFRSIGGLQDAIWEIRMMIEFPFKYKAAYDALGIVPARGILLHGPPGCGKTELARAVAEACELPFYPVEASSMKDKWVGASALNVRTIFEAAFSGKDNWLEAV